MADPMRETALKLYRAFKSARVTALIIAVLMVLFFLGLVIPQKAFFESLQQYEAWKQQNPAYSAVVEALRLNELYVAPVTIFFLCLFFLNLLVVVSARVPLVLKRAYLTKDSLPVAVQQLREDDPAIRVLEITGGTAGGVQDALKGVMKRRLWSFLPASGEGVLFAVKNRYSPIGFLFFHASFLLCLIGGLLVMYTRFSGHLVLTEGEAFSGDMRQFQRILREPKILKELPQFGMLLEKVTPHYEKDVATGLEVDIQLQANGRVERERIGVNQPVKRGSIAVLSQRIGVSPLFVLRDALGTVIDGGYSSLNVLHGGEDSFEFPGVPYHFVVRFYPDHAAENGEDFTRSKDLKNPVARVRVEGREGKIAERNIPLGSSMEFNGMTLAFEDIRYWVEFLVIREYGTLPLSIGFLFGCVGLMMRLVFYQKTVTVQAREEGDAILLYFLGRSEYYQYSFSEELKQLAEEVRSALPQGAVSILRESGKEQ